MKPFLFPGVAFLYAVAFGFSIQSSTASQDAIIEESFLTESYGNEEIPLNAVGVEVPGLGGAWKVTNLGELSSMFTPKFVPEGLEYEDTQGKRLRAKGGAARLQMEPMFEGIWNAQREIDFSTGSPLAAFSKGGMFADQGKIFVSFLMEAWAKNAPFQSTLVLSDSSNLRNSISLTAGFVNSPQFSVRADVGNSGDSQRVIDRFDMTTQRGLTVFVVLAIDLNVPDGARISVWINPPLGSPPPAPDGEVKVDQPGLQFDRFTLRSISPGLPEEIYGRFDEIRFGPSFESVTPVE